MNSWIGGGLSSLKGQLSSFIAEGTEEVTDANDELVFAKNKIIDLEKKIQIMEKEMNELKCNNNELSMKLESEEIMVENMTNNYKEKIKEKDGIIENLTNRLSSDDSGYDICANDMESWKQRVEDLEKEVETLRQREGADVVQLLQDQRQELVLEHENLVLQMQDEYQRQLMQYKRQMQNSESDGGLQELDEIRHTWTDYASVCIQTDETQSNIWAKSSMDINELNKFTNRLEIKGICAILNEVLKLMENKKWSIEDVISVMCQTTSNYGNVQSFAESPGMIATNTAAISDSLSHVSDASEVSIRSRILEEHVASLSQQLSQYEVQLNKILTKNEQCNIEPSELDAATNKIQQLKLKLSQRKNAKLDFQNYQQQIQEMTPETLTETSGEEGDNKGEDEFCREDELDDKKPIGEGGDELVDFVLQELYKGWQVEDEDQRSELRLRLRRALQFDNDTDETSSDRGTSTEKSSTDDMVKRLEHRIQDLERELENWIAWYSKEQNEKNSVNIINNQSEIERHVETFNEVREQEIERLEAQVVSLQNLVEEKEDLINELRQHEASVIFEYEESIRVLTNEMDSLQAELDSAREMLLEREREATKLDKTIQEKENMIRWLNEEMTMLSSVEEPSITTKKVDIDYTERVEFLERILGERDAEIKRLIEMRDSLGLDDDMRNSDENTSENMINKIWELNNLVEEKDNTIQQLSSNINLLQKRCDELENLERLLKDKDSIIEELRSSEKYGELRNKNEHLDESVVTQKNEILEQFNKKVEENNKLEKIIEKKNEEIKNLKKSKVDNDINYEDEELANKAWELENLLEEKTEAFEELENEHNLLLTKREEMEQEIELLRKEYESIEETKEEVLRLSKLIQDKDEEIDGLRKRYDSLLEIVQKQDQQQNNDIGAVNVNAELENELAWYRNNREQLVTALNQKHEESVAYHTQVQQLISELEAARTKIEQHKTIQNEVERLKEKEEKLLREKQMFQQHLLQIEESYTDEATKAEERESKLRFRIRQLEDAQTNEVSEKVDMKTQLENIVRDKNSISRELVNKQQQLDEALSSLNNLQVVLENFQKEQNGELVFLREKQSQEMKRIYGEREELVKRCNDLEKELISQQQLVTAAERLTQQAERKDDQLAQLQADLAQRDELLDSLRMEVRQLNSVTESKVDKLLMRNLIIGYFHTPEKKRTEALRVIGSLLEFSNDDYHQVGVGTENKSSWFSWLKSPNTGNIPTNITTSANTDKRSFSELFVAFLERESAVMGSTAETSTGKMSVMRLPGTDQLLMQVHNRNNAGTLDEEYYSRHSTSSVSSNSTFSPILSKRLPISVPSTTFDSQIRSGTSVTSDSNSGSTSFHIPSDFQKNIPSSSNGSSGVVTVTPESHSNYNYNSRSDSSKNALLSLLNTTSQFPTHSPM